jgi:mono/diheme cytochrome c family protein
VTANFITVLAVVAGITWLGLMVVSALRNRGGEEVAPNLQPGIDDQQLETRRLEKSQKFAIVGAAFLAISLPLYFLGENNRQEGFVEEFADESIHRGELVVEEFACFSCHGPLGVGGVAAYVETRSGVSVDWTAPPLNDVLYRYDEDEVNYWITFGRGNTPMPAWGLAGGGPLNESEVVDIINYLRTIQISQDEAAQVAASRVPTEIDRLAAADATMAAAVLDQEQVLAEIDQAPGDAAFIVPESEKGRAILHNDAGGIDTDADGLSDNAEAELSALSTEAVQFYQAVDAIAMDPNTPDAEKSDEAVAQLTAAIEKDPILTTYLTAVQTILDEDEITDESPDTDGDGISDAAETGITGQMAEASSATVPSTVTEISLDPANPETTGEPDLATAERMVGGLESAAINASVAASNADKLEIQESAGMQFLQMAAEDKAWEIDIPGVAAAMGVSEEDAERAVGLYQGNCARCHTASFSAGMPFTLEAGSGGFGPALWDGRPAVQFGEKPDDDGETDLLIDFLIKGSEAQKPYGLNGFGSGRMPAFGFTLSMDDLELLASYLRSGNLAGTE